MTVIVLRFLEYAAGSILFGAPLFLFYSGLDELRWMWRLFLAATLILAAAVPLHFLAEAAEMAGSPSAMPDGATLEAVFRETVFGKSSLVRAVAAVLALAANFLPPGSGRRRPAVLALLGAIVCASFAWMGHGAATEGAGGIVHLMGDILHTLAAAAWIGALFVFAPWLMQKDAEPRILAAALENFSAFGIAFVATILVTGLVNSWFLIGISRLPALWQSLYGVVLTAKIILFLAMLGLAWRNRSVHTPALARSPYVAALRQSILVETGLGIAILALVAWLGMLPPPASLV